MAKKQCNTKHPTLELKCDQDADHEGAHTATDEDENPHAWVS